MPAEARKRIRMTPEERRDQLLDTARSMIEAEGLQAFTMEALARAASVSTPLVYNYFDSRLALLSALLEREQKALSREITTKLKDAKDFESIVRVFVESNFDHHAPGCILPILMSQPEVAKVIRARQKREMRNTGKLLADSATGEFALDPALADLLIRMASNASIGAAEYGARTGAGRQETVDVAMRFIFEGLRGFTRSR